MRWMLIFFLLINAENIFSQQLTDSMQLTNEQTLQELDDETVLQLDESSDELHLIKASLSKNKIDINKATETLLMQLRIFSPIQVSSLIKYKSDYGLVKELEELQAVPFWTPEMIRKAGDYFYAGDISKASVDGLNLAAAQKNTILIRTSIVLQKSIGYQIDSANNGSVYKGSPARVQLRLSHFFQPKVSVGMAMEKDPGESMFRRNDKPRVDHLVFHVQYASEGWLKKLILGNYVLSLGNGLIQWQTFAQKNPMLVADVSRYAQVVKAYRGFGEFNYHRGMAFTCVKGAVEFSGWFSQKKLDALMVKDTIGNNELVTSVVSSGLHRTEAELNARKQLTEQLLGIQLLLHQRNFKLGFNALHYHWSKPFQLGDKIYQRFEFSADHLNNFSVFYDRVINELHFFGETAIAEKQSLATVNGLQASLSRRLDLAFVVNHIPTAFHAFYASTLTHSSTVNNEKSAFALLNFQANIHNNFALKLMCFRSPWLNYGDVSAKNGVEYRLQWLWTPAKNKQGLFSFVYRKYFDNLEGAQHTINYLHVEYAVKAGLSTFLTSKMDWNSNFSVNRTTNDDYGFAISNTISGKLIKNQLKWRASVIYFHTDSYFSKVDLNEYDMSGTFLPISLYDKGLRVCLTSSFILKKDIAIGFRGTFWNFFEKKSWGSGYDLTPGNNKTEIALSVKWQY